MCHRSDSEKVQKIVSALGLKIKPQDLKSKDPNTLLNAIMAQWLPLAPATFRAIVQKVPEPKMAQRLRLPRILHPEVPQGELEQLQPANDLERDLYEARSDSSATCMVAYVTKMFAVPTADLPQNQRRQLTAEEMRQRGREARAQQSPINGAATEAISLEQAQSETSTSQNATQKEKEQQSIQEDVEAPSEETLIGFTRLYAGTLKAGQVVYALLPKYNTSFPPNHPSNKDHFKTVKITNLYMLMGRELVLVDSVPAGNVFGIGGLEGKVIRSATLCSRVFSAGATSDSQILTECPDFFVNLGKLYQTVRRLLIGAKS